MISRIKEDDVDDFRLKKFARDKNKINIYGLYSLIIIIS